MGTGRPDGPRDFAGPSQTGDPVACLPVRSQVLSSTGTSLDQCTCQLEAIIGVMILIEADWERPWLPSILASDASLSGNGAAQSFWSISDVTAVGWVPEVKNGDAVQQLLVVMLLGLLGFRVDSRSGEVLRDCFGRPVSLDPELAEMISSERRETDPKFPEVPSRLLSSHGKR